jgi:hypothetical protein
MLNFCGIVVTILKMAAGRNFSMSWLPKHGIKMGVKNSTLSDIIKI